MKQVKKKGSAKRAGIKQRLAVVRHLERARRMAKELLKGGEAARKLLVLGQDGLVLLLQLADVLGGFGENRALNFSLALYVQCCVAPPMR